MNTRDCKFRGGYFFVSTHKNVNMTVQANYKYCLLSLLALSSCSKGKSNKPVTSGGDTTAITPQKDPIIAASVGFFLDDWTPKTFVAPLYSTVAAPSSNATVTINVDYSTVITKVPKYLFGNNATAYTAQLANAPDLVSSIKNLSPNVLRFPGGSLSDGYFWNGVMPADAPDSVITSGTLAPAVYWFGNNVPGWQFSLTNYYTLLQQTNSTGIITVNYAYARYGTSAHPDQVAAHLAANWVRYDKGRTKYWEIGNEDYGSWEAGYKIDVNKNKDGQPQIISGALYGTHFKVFADSMRAAAVEVGSKIEIGAQVIGTNPVNSSNPPGETWNNGLFASAGDSPDFYVIHDYFTGEDNETAAVILNTAATETNAITAWMNTSTKAGSVSLKPIALTEWNITAMGSRQMVSNVAGLHADLALGAMLKNQFGMASRWNLVSGWGTTGNDQGMFSTGEPGVADNTPHPAFYHMYYFQKYFGDRMVSSTVQNSSAVLAQNIGDIVAYASSFTSGEAGVVIVNKGTASQIVSVKITNFVPGTRYYYYTMVGGTDNGEFSEKVYINGNGPDISTIGGPSGYQTLTAVSSSLTRGIKVSAPPRSVIFLVAENKK